MTRLTELVLRRRTVIVLAWTVAGVLSLVALPAATSSLSHRFDVPGREGFATNAQILEQLGSGGAYPPLVLAVTVPPGQRADAPAVAAGMERAARRIARAIGSGRVASYGSTDARHLVSRDGRTAVALVFEPPDPRQPDANPDIAARATGIARGLRVAGQPVRLTGLDVLRADAGSHGGISVLLETLIGATGALVVLLFVFGSAIAVVPLLIAAVAIGVTYSSIWAMTAVGPMSFLVEFFVALVGLGVAIDYSLLITSRWRQERVAGAANDDAVRQAMATAGRAVVTSGTTVGLGLLALMALPLGFLRSVGAGGMAIALVSTAAATTLLPALLATVGPRLDWPRRPGARSRAPSARWQAWARAVVRRRWLALAAGTAVLVALALPALGLQPGNPSPTGLTHGRSEQALVAALAHDGIGIGVMTPVETLAPRDDAAALGRRLTRLEGVNAVLRPSGPGWSTRTLQAVTVLPAQDASTAAGERTLERVRRAAEAFPGVGVGGRGAQNADFVDAVYGSFPLMLALIAVVTLALLVRALRSIVLPIKAMAMNLLSVAATWGALVLIWQHGYGAQAWGSSATESITAWVPLMVFAFLYGISMDYEIFILARIREEYDVTGDTHEAVVQGMARTGPLVTSAALILILAFTAMSAGPDADVKIAASGLAIGLLLDATVVRCLLVPASVALFGAANWWMPGFVPDWPRAFVRKARQSASRG